ncbi:MAG: DUF533 domain-containing protein [Candidatus Hydrogenedens sp.]|nr:DUF533 domain-containing protein [Candidatus Hydrogenedens sp.]
MDNREFQSIAMLSLMAAFADGKSDEAERAKLKEVFAGFAELDADAYRRVLMGEVSMSEEAARITRPELRTLAYEMALAVCDADGASAPEEVRFLEELRQALGLEASAVAETNQQAEAIAEAPLAPPAGAAVPAVASAPADVGDSREAEIESTILNYAIMNGALELLPQSMATMAILPLQMRLVYLVGKQHGVELDSGHVKEFLAVAGVGMTSQVLENMARKVFGGFVRAAAGRSAGRLASTAAGPALTFATTHAIGQAARQYYRGGRRLDQIDLKTLFSRQLEEAKGLYGKYSGQVEQRSQSLDMGSVMNMVRGTR